MRNDPRLLTFAVALALGLLGGCDRSPAPPPKPPTTQSSDRVALPAQKPEYSFAAGLSEQYPEVVGFLRHFLETCLAGDYSGYRRLVARRSDPQSRARFERILHALRTLEIESIEQIELREVPPPVYLVIGKVDFMVERKNSPHRPPGPRRVGILVLREDDEWRTTLAPNELQPVEPTTQPTTGPTTSSAPSYPWDEDGDY